MNAVAQRRSPTRSRDNTGRFARARNPLVYYEIVREGAVIAARRDFDPLKEPTAVTQAAWNSARRALIATYGLVPQAHEICRQLPPDRDGKRFRWGELLELVFDESRDVKKTHEERLSEPDDPIGHEDVYWGLNRIAQFLGKTTLRPHEYEEARDRLLAAAGAGTRASHALRLRLPTRGQIESACDRSWDSALRTACLLPRGSGEQLPKRKLPITDAICLFAQGHGHLPSEAELLDASTRQDVLLERDNRSWAECVTEAAASLPARGLRDVAPYGLMIQNDPLPNKQPSYRQGEYTRVEVIEAVRQFVISLPPNTPATDKRWRAFQRGREGIPSLNVIVRHGRLQSLLREAGRPDWRKRAEAWRPSRQQTPSHRGRPKSQRRDQLRSAVASMGEASASALALELGWRMDTVRYYLRVLRSDGVIAATQQHPHAKNQTYRVE